jgi:1-acyl-sn-glycerol-3-phosphate acyltransferase
LRAWGAGACVSFPVVGGLTRVQVDSSLDAPRTSSADDVERRLLALAAELVAQAGGSPAAASRVGLDAQLDRDLGLDSLARVELGLRVERAFAVRLPAELAAQAQTLRDLLAGILAGTPGAAAAASRVVQRPAQGADCALPDEARTLLEVLDWHAERQPERIHVTFLASDESHETLTYGELRTRARRVAAGLQRAGLVAHDPVAIMLPSGLEYFATWFGVLLGGGIPVPIYPPARMATIEDHLHRQAGILQNCEATLLVTLPEAKLLARLLRAEVPSLRQVLTARELERDAGEPLVHAVGPHEIALLQYTSGSTGNPKGVILTHADLLANVRAMGKAVGANPRDVFVSWLPLYHDMGLIGAWLGSLYFAMHLVLMSPLAFLARPSRWLAAVHTWRGTISAAPNFAYELLASRVDEQELEGLDLSSWRWAFNGAEAISAGTLDRFAKRFAPHGLDPRSIAPVFGLAECALDLAFPPSRRGALVDHVDRGALSRTRRAVPVSADHPRAVPIVACGRALEGYAIRIVDRAGRELGERVEGRVEFKGPSATQGYYRNPEATAALRDGDWLDTGDLGYLADGELHLTGRAKDVIIRGGHNVYPYELEDAVGAIPGVRKGCVAVFGSRDSRTQTERIIVVAETREPERSRREALRAEVNRRAIELIGSPADEVVLAPPQSVRKTSSGKIRRSATREAYERGAIGAAAVPAWRQLLRLGASSVVASAGRWSAALGRALYGAWFWFAFAVTCLVAAAGAFLIPGQARRQRFAGTLCRLLAAAVGARITLEGGEHLPRGPFALVANHQSFADVFVLFAAIPRELVFVAKREYREQAAIGPLLARVGTRFVERFDGERSVADARALAAAARAGETLAFFPEGTFRRAPGLLAFRSGAFVTAAEAGVPVIPVALVGDRAFLRADAWIPRPGAIRVVVAPPLVAEESGFASAARLRAAARAAILARCGEPDAADEVAPVFALRTASPRS